MTWYAAHLLFYVKRKQKRQTRYPLWENIVLLKARTLDEAFAKAEERGRNDPCMVPDDTLTWNGVSAEWVFAGVRKLTTCMDEQSRPGDGTEVTYLELEAASWADLQKLLNGEPVSIRLEDGFPAEAPARAGAAALNGR